MREEWNKCRFVKLIIKSIKESKKSWLTLQVCKIKLFKMLFTENQ